jgi:hypothetical protein
VKKIINILHLASFTGNIGDNANHAGSRRGFGLNFDFSINFTELEIREFYWKNKFFDEKFAAECNSHDAVMIGGGNFFELWVKDSQTGTSIDISIEIFKKIKKPVIFYSLGIDAGQGYTEQSISRFRTFLDFLIDNPNKYFLSGRNDGAMHTLHKIIGKKYAEHFVTIPDGGFLLNFGGAGSDLLKDKSVKYIGLNLAGDMLETRFPNRDSEEVLKQLSHSILKISEQYSDYKFVFFPHILRDLNLLTSLFKFFPDNFFRKKVIVGPLINGDLGMKLVFQLYGECDLILGNRFHSNVCSIAQGVPTIGLVNYSQIKLLYDEIGIPERTIDISNSDFQKKLQLLVNETLDDLDFYRSKYSKIRNNILEEYDVSIKSLHQWMKKNI